MIIVIFDSSAVPITAVLGKARCHALHYQYIQAVEVINPAIISNQSCLPLYIEKMKIQLALNEWENVIDTARR